MMGDTSLVTAEGGERDSPLVDAIKEAVGGAADEVVVQAASGGGATNESNVEVNIEKVEVHVHE